MGKDLDGSDKNKAVVKAEFEELGRELATLPPRLKAAWAEKDIKEILHILTNYIGEPIDKLPRFWMYVWPLRWGGIAYFICYLIGKIHSLGGSVF